MVKAICIAEFREQFNRWLEQLLLLGTLNGTKYIVLVGNSETNQFQCVYANAGEQIRQMYESYPSLRVFPVKWTLT